MDYISIPDDYEGYPLNVFCIPKHYEACVDRVLIPRGLIDNRIEKLAKDITDEFASEPVTVLCVLKGGYRFFADLCDKMMLLSQTATQPTPVSVDFIRVSSYVDDKSSGKVKITGGDSMGSLMGKNVLVVEDIVDTGRTMVNLLEVLNEQKPKKLKVASLLVKRSPEANGYRPDYTGFEIPNHFVVGHALDYNENFRDLPHICIINEYGKKKYAAK